MRMLMLLLPMLCGCEAILISTSIADAKDEEAARLEIRALRRNAGLTEAEYQEELLRYDPAYVRKSAERRMKHKLRRTSGYSDARTLLAQLPRSMRAEHDALPKEPTYWPWRYQLYRASRLGAGATEAEVLAELKEQYPLWHKTLRKKWPHFPG